MSKLTKILLAASTFLGFKEKAPKFEENHVAILKLGGLGDLAITLNLIRCYIQQFPNKRVTLIYDSRWTEIIDHYCDCLKVPIDVDIFLKNRQYREDLYRALSKTGFSVLLVPTVSKTILLEDSLSARITAKQKITIRDDGVNSSAATRLVLDFIYDQHVTKTSSFEYSNIKHFFSYCGIKNTPESPLLSPSRNDLPKNIKKPYLLAAVGAGDPRRSWPVESFKEMLRRLGPRYQVVFIGRVDTNQDNQTDFKDCPFEVVNLINQSNPLMALSLVENAGLVVANESGPIHIAAAFSRPFICISNGNHYLRFHPYDSENGLYIYPPNFIERFSKDTSFKNLVTIRSPLSANEIRPEIAAQKVLASGIAKDLFVPKA